MRVILSCCERSSEMGSKTNRTTKRNEYRVVDRNDNYKLNRGIIIKNYSVRFRRKANIMSEMKINSLPL